MNIKTVLISMAAPAALLAAGSAYAQQDMDTDPMEPSTAPMQEEQPPVMEDPVVEDDSPMMEDDMDMQASDDAMPMQSMKTAAKSAEIKPKDFVMAAAHSGNFEIQTSELALEMSENEDVRSYAEMMIADHEAMSMKLKDVANRRVPKETGPAQTIIVADLGTKSGTEFDEAYLKGQVTGHEATIAFFEAMAASDADPELQEFAQMGLPKLREHLEEAKSLAEDMGAM